MCHSGPVLHALFNPWRCYTPYFRCLLQENIITMQWVTETKHKTPSRYKGSFYVSLRPSFTCPFQSMTVLHTLVPMFTSRKRYHHAVSYRNKAVVLCNHRSFSIPWIRIQNCKSMLIRENAVTCPDIHWRNAVGALSSQSVLPTALRITIDY